MPHKEKELRETRCCFTGHRPEKLNCSEADIIAELDAGIDAAIDDGFTTFISGMSRGVDLWAAQLVLAKRENNRNIRLISAVPYKNFEKRWSKQWQQIYNSVLNSADLVKIFSDTFNYQSIHQRNRWMVDHSARMIAAYNGSTGGTKNTILYARQLGLDIRYIFL